MDSSKRAVRRLVLLALGAGVAAGGVAAGCASSETNVTVADASTDDAKATPVGDDDDPNPEDAGPTKDASTKDATTKDANGPGQSGDECSFNRDCANGLRCECDGACACKAGVRGTGQNGLDACDSGNDCSSAVCLEGPGDSGFLCSDECATAAECPAKLPRCEDISFVGRICVRQP